MKKLFILLICLWAPLLFAQNVSKTNYYISTGISKTYAPEDFNKFWREGFNLGVGVGRLITPRVEIQGTLAYNSFDLNTTAYIDNGTLTSYLLNDSTGFKTVDGGQTSIISFLINLKAMFPTKQNLKVVPYFVGGIGYSRINFDEIQIQSPVDTKIEPSHLENVLTTGVGIGFEFDVSEKTDIYLEGKFNVMFTEQDATVIFPIKFGITIH